MDIQEVREQLHKAPNILIGIGSTAFRNDFLSEDVRSWSSINEYIKSAPDSWPIINKIIQTIIADKDFFVLTTSWDSHLDDTIPADKLFTPSGNCHKLQCYNACSTQMWDYEDFKSCKKQPLCPNCQSELVMNIKTDAFFIKDLYNSEEKNYHLWLHKNYNNRILLLEIESSDSEDDKNIISKPFENITAALPNATLLRINSRDLEVPEVIKNKTSTYKIELSRFLDKINY